MPFVAAPVALTAAATAASVTAAVVSGVQARNAAQFQERIARQNAELAREAGGLEAERRRRGARRTLGGLQARGAPADVIADAASELELDALLAEFGGSLQARDAGLAASAARFRGRSATISAGLNAATALFSGALETNSFLTRRTSGTGGTGAAVAPSVE